MICCQKFSICIVRITSEYMIQIFLIILILLILFIAFDKHNTDKIELYDMEILGITDVDCGTRCTQGENCVGFAYKPSESKCYLSKSTILGKPIEALYNDSYSKLDRRCNKINRITDSTRIDGNTLTRNSIYACTDGEIGTSTEFQYAKLGATALSQKSSSDQTNGDYDIPENVDYKTYQIDWSKTKNTVTDKIKPFFDSSQKISVTDDEKKPKSYGFIESDKEYLGQYLLAHQCVANVPQYDCLRFCEQNKSCIGTEWNKMLTVKEDNDDNYNYMYEDVCCPKIAIKQIIQRRNKMNRGKFYVKTNIDTIPIQNQITLSRSNNIKPIQDPMQIDMTDYDTLPKSDTGVIYIDNKN
jgi:hypothetical protein